MVLIVVGLLMVASAHAAPPPDPRCQTPVVTVGPRPCPCDCTSDLHRAMLGLDAHGMGRLAELCGQRLCPCDPPSTMTLLWPGDPDHCGGAATEIAVEEPAGVVAGLLRTGRSLMTEPCAEHPVVETVRVRRCCPMPQCAAIPEAGLRAYCERMSCAPCPKAETAPLVYDRDPSCARAEPLAVELDQPAP